MALKDDYANMLDGYRERADNLLDDMEGEFVRTHNVTGEQLKKLRQDFEDELLKE